MDVTPNRLIALERDAWRSAAEQGDPGAVAAMSLTATAVGPATALRCRAAGPLLNRVYDAPADATRLATLRDHYESAGVPLYFLYVDGADRAPGELERAGLVRYRRGMVYLARDLSASVAPVSTALDVGLATPGELARATEIYCAAFDVDRGLAPVIASMHGAPGWHFLVARAGGEPIAIGILYVQGEHAVLLGGATSPRFRQRGAQSALVTARVALARELGCAWIGGYTGEPVADDPQHSLHNMIRAGLVPIGRVDSYTPPGIVWTHGRRGTIGAR